MDHVQLIKLRENIFSFQKDLNENYLESRESLHPDSNTIYTANMNERVVRFLDHLIDILRKLLSHDRTSFMVYADVKDQIEILVDELGLLRCNLLDILELYLKEEEDTMVKEIKYLCVSTQKLIIETGFLIYFFPSDDKGKNEQNVANNWCSPCPDSLEADSFKRQASSCFLYDNKRLKERANYWIFHLPDLLETVDSLKQQASDIYNSGNKYFTYCRKSSSSTNKMEYVNFLIKNLEELMHSEANSIDPLKSQIQKIYQGTVYMKKCLVEFIADDQLMKSQSQIGSLVARFERAADQSCYIVDSFLAGQGPLWFHKLGMFAVANDMKTMQTEMKGILKMRIASDAVADRVSCPPSSLANIPTKINSTVGAKNEMNSTRMEESSDKLVGMRDAALELIDLLIGNRTTQLKIFSIVGMPGIGKTTLANSVYKHPSVTYHFHVHAWCHASQTYQKEALLFEILSQLVGKNNQSNEARNDRNEFDALRLYQNLKGRRFLILIDDVWDLELWNNLKEAFPDDHNGSRILFTTPNHAVALAANSVPYALRLLSTEESCELLLSKVFDHETCPLELSAISTRIARNCKGLPLALVLFAGILKRTDKRKDSWEKFHRTVCGLRHTHAKDSNIVDFTNMLEFTYKHLPNFLKPCFLYFGAFPVGASIPVSKLIRLWISEGFVQEVNFGQKSLEHEAKDYLNELIDRNLVMIARRSSLGRVKACRVHDVLQKFCAAKLDCHIFVFKEVEFRRSLYDPYLNMQIRTFLYDHRLYPTDFGQFHGNFQEVLTNVPFKPRLNGYSETRVFRYKPNIVSKGKSVCTRVNGAPIYQTGQSDYGLIFKYGLLGVLDLGNVGVESSADSSDLVMIARLVHLRYLAIRPRGNEIPTEMGNLQKLETFALSGVIGDIMLPESVWTLASLRHLLTDHGFFSFQHCGKDIFKEFPEMYNLKSVSILALRCGSNVEKFILRRLPKIEKLGCRLYDNSWDYFTGGSIFPELDFLSELKSLKVFFSGKVRCPCKFSFPSNLTKLALSNSHLPWKEISFIGQLPNLQVLKLLNKAFEGKQWDMKDDEFQRLKYLKLESLDIEVWNAFAPEHLPYLEQLLVLHCPKLKEIPSSFGEIATLKLIEMKWCSSRAMDSVKEVLEFQREMSNDELNVTLVGPA